MWCCRCARYVHYAVDLCIVARERLANVQVCQAHTCQRVDRVEVQRCSKRVAAKVYRSSLSEEEIALKEILHRELIMPCVHDIIAEEVKSAFVKVVGLQHAVSVKRNKVAALVVHEQFYGSVGCAVDKEINLHVRSNVSLLVFFCVLAACYV